MKKLSVMYGLILFLSVLSRNSFAVTYFNYHTDLLEPGNPGGWAYSHKTFDGEYTVIVGKTSAIDIWVHDVLLYEGIIYADLWIEYNPGEVEVTGLEVFDGVNGPPGPWDPEATSIIADPNGPGTYMVSPLNMNCVQPDNDGDVIIARINLKSLTASDTAITVAHQPVLEPTMVGCNGYSPQYMATPHTITLHQIIIDSDADGIPDHEDNCPLIPNGPALGICREGNAIGTSCTSDEGCGSNGDCYLNQEDMCSCVSNFDCDYDVDGSDVARLKSHFGRNLFNDPCNNENPCTGDFDCDGNVDGSDAARFKKDFGAAFFCSAYTVCSGGYGASCMRPCMTCVDGIYAYTCSYE